MSERAAPGVAVRAAAPSRGLLPRAALWLGFAVLLVVLPKIFVGGFALSMMSQMGIAVVFALSFNMLLGQTGLLSFGHAVFMGLGGFIAMHALRAIDGGKLPIPIVVLPLIGAAGGLVFGIVFGWLATRRAGTAFSMITLGIAELVASSTFILRGFFGGEEGMNGDRTAGLAFLGFDFGPQLQVYYLIAAWMFIAIVAMYALTRTPLGRMANAVRDNPERVAFVGYDPGRIRFMMFAFSAMFAGLAGGLYAINYEIVTSFNLGVQASGVVLLMTYIGGVGHFVGPILGAALITFLQVSLGNYTEAWLLYLGLLFVAMVMFAPDGLAGLLLRHGPLVRAGALHRLVPGYAMALVPMALLLFSIVCMVEMGWRLSVQADKGPEMQLLFVPLNALSIGSWALAFAAFILGAIGLRFVGPRVGRTWQELAPAR